MTPYPIIDISSNNHIVRNLVATVLMGFWWIYTLSEREQISIPFRYELFALLAMLGGLVLVISMRLVFRHVIQTQWVTLDHDEIIYQLRWGTKVWRESRFSRSMITSMEATFVAPRSSLMMWREMFRCLEITVTLGKRTETMILTPTIGKSVCAELLRLGYSLETNTINDQYPTIMATIAKEKRHWWLILKVLGIIVVALGLFMTVMLGAMVYLK